MASLSRQEKLKQAQKLSKSINDKTASLSFAQIEEDVKRVFKDIKLSRGST